MQGSDPHPAEVWTLANPVEKFPLADLSSLRDELLQSGLDSRQAAELISAFLAGRGYGVSSDNARNVATRIDVPHCSFEAMQRELEALAYVM